MRKLMTLATALLGVSVLTVGCGGDDPEEAEKMAQNCVDLGQGDDAECECVGDKASEAFSTDEYNEALEGDNDEVAEQYQDIVAECTGDEATAEEESTEED